MKIQKAVTHVDLGAGNRKKDGFFAIDIDAYEGVDLVLDLRFNKLPFDNNQLEHVYASHFMEHLDFHAVIFLMNEVYRCLRVGGKFEIIVPHGQSYGHLTDLSHKTAWTEDTFGYFTQENEYYYSWFYELDGKRTPVINKWKILKNDNTNPYEYTKLGWTEVKLREVHAMLEKT